MMLPVLVSLAIALPAFMLIYMLKKAYNNKLVRYLTILLVGIASSIVPFGLLGVAMGLCSVLVNTLALAIIFDKELS